MTNQRVSVVMATYNGEKYIEEQLSSIFSQTLKPTEIIVCDDNSSDSTPKILQKLADKNLIKYFENKPQLGVIKNFRKGASLCEKSNFIAFSDQDDIWLPNKLEVLTQEIITKTDLTKPAMVFSDLTTVDKYKNIINKSLWNEFNISPTKQTLRTLLIRNIVPGCTMLINNKMNEELLHIPEEAYMHDAWITFIAFIFHNYSFINDALIYHRNHEDNVLHTITINDNTANIYSKVLEYITGTFFNKPILSAEFEMADAFYKRYEEIMQPQDLKIFRNFLNLRKRNYFLKKMHIRHINKIEHP
ncbi:glycosyltransferase family 2 protein [Mucilaginibacter sp.]